MTEEKQSFRALARPALESIRLLLAALGNPQDGLRCIHVAGTNGKGSVCAFLQMMFTKAGRRTGKYISPHLIHDCERISVDGAEISPAELRRLMQKVSMAAKKTEQKLGTPPTMFELWTAAALCYFEQCECDIVIVETGLGGTHDATNIIPPPLISVITRIAMDHMDYLGANLSEIASAKAGIIKCPADGRQGCTVTIPQFSEAAAVLKTACQEKNNRLIVTGQPVIHRPSGIGECFDYRGMENIRLKMLGFHQIENACLAAEAAFCAGLPGEAVRFGLENAVNPGRFELIAPGLIFDGAHNQDGMAALIHGLNRYFPEEPRRFIFGCMRDKDIDGALSEIAKSSGSVKTVYTVRVKDSPRAVSAEELADLVGRKGFRAVSCRNIREAVCLAKQAGNLAVICGSLYLYHDLYAEYLQLLQG